MGPILYNSLPFPHFDRLSAYAHFIPKMAVPQVNINDYVNPGIAAAVNPSLYGYHFGSCSVYAEVESANVSGPMPNNNHD